MAAAGIEDTGMTALICSRTSHKGLFIPFAWKSITYADDIGQAQEEQIADVKPEGNNSKWIELHFTAKICRLAEPDVFTIFVSGGDNSRA